MLALAGGTAAQSEQATFTYKSISTETALKAAQAALKKCRDSGFQVAVAVVDRSGNAMVLLRDRYAGPHTPDTATGKARTAINFRTSTASLAEQTRPGRPASGIRNLPNVVAIGGGMIIEGGGQLVGGIGVSGAPGPDKDEVCANAGIASIEDLLEF